MHEGRSLTDMLAGKGVYTVMTFAQRMTALLIFAVMLFVTPWLTVSLLDRKIPMIIEHIVVSPAVASRGQLVNVDLTVRRDRLCYTHGYSYFFDSERVRWSSDWSDYKLESEDHGVEHIKIARFLPREMASGQAQYRVVLYQRCPLNPFHLLWPVVEIADSDSFSIISDAR